ncbi:MAG: TrmH family RNA methyltransferase [Hymenobacter sp.]
MTQDISALARAAGVPVSLRAACEKLEGLTRKNHQGAVAFVSPIDFAPLDTLLAGLFEEGKVPFLLLLDRVTDVRNFGAIARTAECLGVQALVVPAHGAAQINGDAVKTFGRRAQHPARVPRARPAPDHQFPERKRLDHRRPAPRRPTLTSASRLPPASAAPLPCSWARRKTASRRSCCASATSACASPMSGQIQSLNVGVAAGIVLFEVARQRQG